MEQVAATPKIMRFFYCRHKGEKQRKGSRLNMAGRLNRTMRREGKGEQERIGRPEKWPRLA